MNKKIFIIGTISFIIDQITKCIIGSLIEPNESIIVIKNFFSLTNVENTGAAFSILENKSIFLLLISVVAIVIIIKMSKDFKKNIRNTISMGLLLGGIFGNFGDRLFLGVVRDFLSFKIFGYNFPVFNVADMCIVVGVCLLMYSILLGDDKDEDSSRSGNKNRKNRQVSKQHNRVF